MFALRSTVTTRSGRFSKDCATCSPTRAAPVRPVRRRRCRGDPQKAGRQPFRPQVGTDDLAPAGGAVLGRNSASTCCSGRALRPVNVLHEPSIIVSTDGRLTRGRLDVAQRQLRQARRQNIRTWLGRRTDERERQRSKRCVQPSHVRHRPALPRIRTLTVGRPDARRPRGRQEPATPRWPDARRLHRFAHGHPHLSPPPPAPTGNMLIPQRLIIPYGRGGPKWPCPLCK